MGLLDWLQAAIDDNQHSEDSHAEDTTASVSPSLYVCESCNVTYIATEMDSCPSCTEPIEEVPKSMVE